MSIKPIVKIPDPILLKKTEKVNKIDDEIVQMVKDLRDTLKSAKEPEGAGLAAPQIGSLKRICIVRRFLPDPIHRDNALIQEFVLINPKIISESDTFDIDYEGCLSIPDTYGKVKRSTKIKVRAQNLEGEDIVLKATDFFARVIQHEIDHLDGILFTSKVIGETINESEMEELMRKEEGVVTTNGTY